MTSIKLIVKGANARAVVDGPLTSGAVGIPVTITYDSAWDGLTKALICRSEADARTILGVEDTAMVAHEVMKPDRILYIGVEGRNADGTLVIPTVWARCGHIQPGATSDADPSLDPRLPVWQQLREQIGDLADLKTEDKSNLVAAINEALAKGGGEADPEEITKIVNEYLAANPPEDGADGRGIVSIARTSGDGSAGTVDTYTITYTDETTSTFQVRNGSDGQDGADGKDGNDGETPYIGENGNWWIGDTDTGKPSHGEDGKDGSGTSAYKWIPRGLMRKQVGTFQGWTHCVRYDERLGKAVGIVMHGEASHTNEQPWYRVTIDGNGNMSDYEEIVIYDTDGATQITPNNGYVCGFCILSDGTYLIQDNDFTTDSSPNFYKSTDYGKTFAKYETDGIPTQAFGLRQLSTGRIICGCTGGYNRFYYSDDLGVTWSESNTLDVSVLGNPPFEADSTYEFAEHHIIEFQDGTLLAIGRTSNNARNAAGTVRGHLEGAAIAYSDDHGETWRDFGWSKTITNMTSNNAACVYIDGIYHLVMGDRYTYTEDKGGTRRYFAMYYQYATEEDALNDNWSDPVVIDYGHWTADATVPTDSGYPSLWKDASNNLHCVFYDGDGSGMAYGANWRLIDGNPYISNKLVSDENGGSMSVSYSQAQVEALLEAQRTSMMSVLMMYITDLYDKAESLIPDSGANDGANYITSDLLLYFNLVDTSLWDETGVYCAAKYSAAGDVYWHLTSLSALEISSDFPAVWQYGEGDWDSNMPSTYPYKTNVTLAELGVDSTVGFSLEFGGFVSNKSTPTKTVNATFDYRLTRNGIGLSWPNLGTVPTIVDGVITGVSCGSIGASLSAGDLLHVIYVFTPDAITVYRNGVKIGDDVAIDEEQYNTLKTTYVSNCGGNNASRTINRLYNAPLTADQCMNNYKWFKNFVDNYEYAEDAEDTTE